MELQAGNGKPESEPAPQHDAPIFDPADWPSLVTADDQELDDKEIKAIRKRRKKIGEMVLLAIDIKYRVMPSIKRHIGAPDWFDLEDLLMDMCGDYILRKWDLGAVDAYFRYETLPLRAWLIGGGCVDAEFDETFTPRDERKKQAELNGGRVIDDEIPDANVRKTKQRREIDDVALEEAVASCEDLAAVAAELDVSTDLLQDRIKESVVLQAAVKAGQERNPSYVHKKPTQKPATPAHSDVAGPSSSLKPGRKIAAVEIETLVAKDPRLESIANEMGVSVKDIENDQRIKDAWKRGRAMYTESLRPAAQPIEVEEVEEHDEESEETMTAAATAQEKGPGYRLKFTAEELERLAETHGDKQQVALGVGYTGNFAKTALAAILRRNPELKEGFDKGMATFKAKQAELVTEVQSDRPDRKGRGIPLVYSAEDVQTAAAKHYTVGGTAIALGYASPTPFKRKLTLDETYRKAFENGQAEYVAEHGEAPKRGTRKRSATDTAVGLMAASMESGAELAGPQATPISGLEPSSMDNRSILDEEDSRTDIQTLGGQDDPEESRIEKVKPHRIGMEIDDEAAPKRPTAMTATQIPIGSGGIFIAIDVNMFEMNREDRDRLSDLIDVAQSIAAKSVNRS